MPVGAFPVLKTFPNCGNMKSIPWADASEHASSTGGLVFGPDGVSGTMVIYISWSALNDALVALLGFSQRLLGGTTASRFIGFPPKAITGASNETPIKITSVGHNLVNKDTIFIFGIVGNLAANGRCIVTVTDADSFTIAADPSTVAVDGSIKNGNNLYVSGGEWVATGAVLSRSLPWQHPLFPQMWVKRVAAVHGVQLAGTTFTSKETLLAANFAAGAGPGQDINIGPWSDFTIAKITLEFWRPPYAVLSDQYIRGNSGISGPFREWLRYTDRQWEISSQLLTRENTAFAFTDTGIPVRGGVGQKITHLRVTRKWYNIPEAALFGSDIDGTPAGLPLFLLFTQTKTTNPVTNYIQYPGQAITGCVNSPIGGGKDDTDPKKRFFGCYMGELLYEGVEITPAPLQLPAQLMNIPNMAQVPISQMQYDLTFHLDRFDPPRGAGVAIRGHNLLPKSGDGLWYPVQSQQAVGGLPAVPKTTPFQYCDMSDIFQLL